MSRLQATLLLVFLILSGRPATGQAEDAAPSFFYPKDPDYLLINAHEIRIEGTYGETRTESHTLRVFGSGRIEIEPVPTWLECEDVVLEPLAVEHLLRSLDGSLRLVEHHSTQPAPEKGPFIEVHLARYASADWHEVFDYLDAVVTRDLEVAFRDLGLLETWLALRAPRRPIWVSTNSWPELCRPERRLEYGLGEAEPIWCSAPAFYKYPRFEKLRSSPSSDSDEEAQEALRQRLRERLRRLPRGLQGPTSTTCEN